MKKLILYSINVLILLLLVACQKQDVSKPINVIGTELNFNVTDKSFLSSTNSFGINLFTQLGDTATSNLFISPLSVLLDLTMAYNGASGNTATQMQNVLGYNQLNNLEINQACQNVMQQLLNSDPSVSLNIANSIWYRNTLPVLDSFINLNKNYLSAQVEPANFSSSSTVSAINSWVATQTDQKITQVISQIDSSDLMFLINAIYFHGNWTNAFNPQNTTNKTFTLSDGTSYSTPFMIENGSFKFHDFKSFTAAELSYGNGNFSMDIFVPNGSNTPSTILSNLSVSNWNSWIDSLATTQDVTIMLPKFTIKNQLVLPGTLEAMGITDAFNPQNANFSGITSVRTYISNVLHNSFISIDETGTTAAASTTITVTPTVVTGINLYLDANRPFVYFIKENNSNTILFAGIIEQPNSSSK